MGLSCLLLLAFGGVHDFPIQNKNKSYDGGPSGEG